VNIEQKALEFATKAHEGQVRKYTGEPYINHPIAVAEIVRSVPHTPEMIAAAYLHDVVEDCGVNYGQLINGLGVNVARLVLWLTDVSQPTDGNRATRKAMDRKHIAYAPAEAQTIKLADLIHNTSSIAQHDPEFWKVYREEKRALLEAITKGDPTLMAKAKQLVFGIHIPLDT